MGVSCRPSTEVRPPFIKETRAPGNALGGTILFTSDRDAAFGVFAVDPSASPQDRISLGVTAPQVRARSPVYAPGGGRVAYSVVQPGSTPAGGIAVADRSGGPPRLVVQGDGLFDYPSWSPDGAHVAYSYSPDLKGAWNLFVVDVADGTTRQLTNGPRQDWYPAWSPDGARIAFTSDRDGDNAIWWVEADGGGPEKVVDSRAADEEPVWSPDGRRLVFTSNREMDKWQLFEVDPVSRVERQVIRTDSVDRYPRFSPDGRYLVVSSGYVAVYRSDGGRFPNGADRWKITGRLSLGGATWSPNTGDYTGPA